MIWNILYLDGNKQCFRNIEEKCVGVFWCSILSTEILVSRVAAICGHVCVCVCKKITKIYVDPRGFVPQGILIPSCP